MDSVMTALREDEKTSTATMKTLQQGVLRTVEGGGGRGATSPYPWKFSIFQSHEQLK